MDHPLNWSTCHRRVVKPQRSVANGSVGRNRKASRNPATSPKLTTNLKTGLANQLRTEHYILLISAALLIYRSVRYKDCPNGVEDSEALRRVGGWAPVAE